MQYTLLALNFTLTHFTDSNRNSQLRTHVLTPAHQAFPNFFKLADLLVVEGSYPHSNSHV